MGIKDVVGSIWPNYGAVTGRGSYGKMLNPEKAADVAQQDEAQQEAQWNRANTNRQNAIAAQFQGYGMKKGGKVSSASSRADGIAKRGKTKGTMVMCGGGMAKGKKK